MKLLRKKKNFTFCIIILLSILFYSVNGKNKTNHLNLKSQCYILGPSIKLGDVAEIKIPDKKLQVELEDILLGKAAPAGEVKELKRSFIKGKIRETVFFEFAKELNGPKVVTIFTIPTELRNMFIEEGFAGADTRSETDKGINTEESLKWNI